MEKGRSSGSERTRDSGVMSWGVGWGGVRWGVRNESGIGGGGLAGIMGDWEC